MAENDEHLGHDEPETGAGPEGDFPADFFDDASEPSPVSSGPPEPTGEHRHASSYASEPPAEAMRPGPPSSYKPAGDHSQSDDEGIKMSPFPILLGVVMLGVLVAAWVVNRQSTPAPAVAVAPAPAAAAPASAEAVPASGVEGAPTATPVAVSTEHLQGQLKNVLSKVDEMAAQIKTIEGKLGDLPKPEPPPDLKPLESKLGELARSVAAVSPLGDKVTKLDDQVGSVDNALKSVKDDLAALKDEVGKVTAAAATAGTEAKPAADDSSAALSGGAELFKAGKYKEADEVFKKLATSNAKDARVYYYAALTRGLTTNDWRGAETLASAAKGAELEKAGSPKAADVDAAFADLPANLKLWVTYFRKQTK